MVQSADLVQSPTSLLTGWGGPGHITCLLSFQLLTYTAELVVFTSVLLGLNKSSPVKCLALGGSEPELWNQN